jgi:hypothetical protein
VTERQGFHVLTPVRENIERIEDDGRISASILQRVETRISVRIESYQLTINHGSGVEGISERGGDLLEPLREVFAVTRQQAHTLSFADCLSAVAIKLQLLCCIRRYVALLFKRG